jgi:hypothetical protein
VDRYEARFDKSKTWTLRIDGLLSGAGNTVKFAQARAKALHGTPGLKIVSVKTSSLPSPIAGDLPRITFTTVTYTYRDGAHGTRWVATRYSDHQYGGDFATEKLTVSGRPQDAGALAVVLNRATQTIQQAG